MTAITTKTAIVQQVVDRAALRLELETTSDKFRALVESISDVRWHQTSPGSKWTICEVMVHVTWALEQLPAEIISARHAKGMFNYPAWLANPASYWITRWNARGIKREVVVRRYATAMNAVLAALDTVTDDEWELGANFYGHGFYTIAQLFHTPAHHLSEHTAALVNEQAHPRDSQMIATCVGSLHVRQSGSGPTAVLWHSLFVDSASWQRVESQLGSTRRLIIIDGPGHGASSDLGKQYTQDDCAAAAFTILDSLGITEPVDWVGNAWGGHVGILVAAAYPERVRSLITIGTPIAAYTPAEARQTRLLLALYRIVGGIGYLQNAVAQVLLAPTTYQHDPAAVDYVCSQIASANRRQLSNAIESISLGRTDLTAMLPKIHVPTLIITGADHAGFTPEQAQAASTQIADGQLAIIPKAAYLVPLEQPNETVQIIQAFWQAKHE